ncbi:CD40 ligand-like [Anguilla rostrata]|uniref:CD40 ligand-like n=1 Tax=Anguilla rostrata TaxID=7938 RepID=UPI0030CEDD99
MINTYSSNLPPPPVPPRPGTQSSMRNWTRSRSHVRFLCAAFVVQTVVTIALFLYLFQRIDAASNENNSTFNNDLIVLKRLEECESNSLDSGSLLDCSKVLQKFQGIISKLSQIEGKAWGLSAPGTPSGTEARAQMTIMASSGQTLKWNPDYSMLKNVEYYTRSRSLQIRVPGYYFVYSQVTFSKAHPKTPLAQFVMRRRSSAERAGEDLLLKAFCSPGSNDLCTSYQAGMFRLEEGQQLYVNVTDSSLVNFEVTTTTFGLFLMQRVP